MHPPRAHLAREKYFKVNCSKQNLSQSYSFCPSGTNFVPNHLCVLLCIKLYQKNNIITKMK